MTLIEMLVTMVILAIVSTMLVGGWISLQRSWAMTRDDNDARAAGRYAIDRITSDIRSCQPVTSTDSPKSSWNRATCGSQAWRR